MKKKRSSGGILWRVLFFLAAASFLAVLELGKHTLPGWGLGLVLLAAFYLLRLRVLKKKGRGLRFLSWCCLLVLMAGVLWVSWPPVRPVPAVEGKNGGTTELNTVFLFTCGHYCWERQALANGIPSYLCHFTRENGRLGSWHSGEEVYLYGNIPADSGLCNAADRDLSRSMVRYFVNFIKTGDPNGEGLPVWPSSSGDGGVLTPDDPIAWEPGPYRELYEILDEMYGFEG